MAQFVKVDDLLTIVINGRSVQVNRSHPHYASIVRCLRSGDDVTLNSLLDGESPTSDEPEYDLTRQDFDQYSEFDYDEDYEQVLYDGVPVDDRLTRYFSDLKSDGLPLHGMVAFVKKLYASTSHRVRSELLDFIKENGLTITDDGNILAYKAIRNDWFDKYSGTIVNRIGSVITMDRNKVNADRQQGCSYGLHVGGLEYIYEYGSNDDRIVITEVDPVNVVSVPEHCSCRKMRVCEYRVVDLYQGKLDRIMYSPDESLYDDEEDYDDDLWDFADDVVSYEPDDSFNDGDVTVVQAFDDTTVIVPNNDATYGTKPDGAKFWNIRDKLGRFIKRRGR